MITNGQVRTATRRSRRTPGSKQGTIAYSLFLPGRALCLSAEIPTRTNGSAYEGDRQSLRREHTSGHFPEASAHVPVYPCARTHVRHISRYAASTLAAKALRSHRGDAARCARSPARSAASFGRAAASLSASAMYCSGLSAIHSGCPTALSRLTPTDRKSTRLNSSHMSISYAVFCLKK